MISQGEYKYVDFIKTESRLPDVKGLSEKEKMGCWSKVIKYPLLKMSTFQ
jgi:hypothetical protein